MLDGLSTSSAVCKPFLSVEARSILVDVSVDALSPCLAALHKQTYPWSVLKEYPGLCRAAQAVQNGNQSRMSVRGAD